MWSTSKVNTNTIYGTIKTHYCNRQGLYAPQVRLLLDGERIADHMMVKGMKLEDGDIVEAFMERECVTTSLLML